jgi:phosphoribosylformylglycinamidine cyclo-ligase
VSDRSDADRSHTGDLTYRASGVDIVAGEEAVRLIKKDVESTYIPGVVGALGGFAGLFELPKNLEAPVLVTATDGVGTKVLLAQEMGRVDTVGIDLVAMSVNDVLTIGARPILFLDYVAVGRLTPDEMVQIVGGVAEGCRRAGCALVGGEMAEMPGLYDPGEFDLAGFCVGLGEKGKLIDGSSVAGGDVVLGLASSGFHSNGYSLVRKVLEVGGLGLSDRFTGFAELGSPVGDLLIEPTRIYVRSVLRLLDGGVPVQAMAHVTGGGMIGNLARVIPEGLSARLDFTEWKVPPLFRAIQSLGGIADDEMFATFNMGIGYVLVVPKTVADAAAAQLRAAGEEVVRLGQIVAGDAGAARVTLQGVTMEGNS